MTHQFGHGAAIEVFRRQVEEIVITAVVENPNHMRVSDPRRETCLQEEVLTQNVVLRRLVKIE